MSDSGQMLWSSDAEDNVNAVLVINLVKSLHFLCLELFYLLLELLPLLDTYDHG